MAYHKSAKKRARQSEKRNLRNTKIRSSVKTAVRAFREAVAAGNKETAGETLETATRALRKAASSGVFHHATASRRVSRLVKAFNAVG